MKTFLSFLFMVLFASLISCNNDSSSQVNPQPAAPIFVSRLIFIGEANIGGSIKIEIKDTYIDSILDGNTDWQDNVLNPISSLPLYASPTKITISNLSYYGETINKIICQDDSNNPMQVQYEGPYGAYFKGPDNKLYRIVGPLQYIEQGRVEKIANASIRSFFLTQCTDDNSNIYEVSFYPDSDDLSHNITTNFDILSGGLKGIIRVHKEGDGYTTYVDMLF
ncbi:MAG: hypothetical protein WCQ47_04685 [bacterium]